MPTEGSNSVSSQRSSSRRPTKLCVSGGRLPGPPPVGCVGSVVLSDTTTSLDGS